MKKTELPGTGSKPSLLDHLWPELKAEDMTIIGKKIRDLLIAEGYALVSCRQKGPGGPEINMNELQFLQGNDERVIISIREPIKTAPAFCDALAV